MALLDSYTMLLPAALESQLTELKPLDAWRGDVDFTHLTYRDASGSVAWIARVMSRS